MSARWPVVLNSLNPLVVSSYQQGASGIWPHPAPARPGLWCLSSRRTSLVAVSLEKLSASGLNAALVCGRRFGPASAVSRITAPSPPPIVGESRNVPLVPEMTPTPPRPAQPRCVPTRPVADQGGGKQGGGEESESAGRGRPTWPRRQSTQVSVAKEGRGWKGWPGVAGGQPAPHAGELAAWAAFAGLHPGPRGVSLGGGGH